MIKTLKAWKALVTLNPRAVVVSAVTSILSVITAIISPIALSNFLGFVSERNISLAFLWLAIDLFLKVFECISWHFNYSNFTRLIGPTYVKLQGMVRSQNLYGVQGEKKSELDYVASNDLFVISSYIDKLLLRVSGIIKLVVVSVIIFFYSYTIGSLVIMVSIIGYVILAFYTARKKKASKELFNKEMSVTQKLDEVYNKRDVIKKYNLEPAVEFDEKRRLSEYIESYSAVTKNTSVKVNLIQIYWFVCQAVMLAVLIFEFQRASLTLTIFLAVYNYLLMYTSITENVFDFKTETMALSASIERFKEVVGEQSLQKSEKTIEEIQSIKIKRTLSKNSFTKVQVGEVSALKSKTFEPLFNNPSGGIVINEENLGDEIFKIVKLVTHENEMFNDSIIENLLILNSDRDLIEKLIESVGLNEFISGLDEGLNSNLDGAEEITNFKFNLVKAMISDSKVILFNANLLPKEELSKIVKTVLDTGLGKTYLIFDSENRINRKNIKNVE